MLKIRQHCCWNRWKIIFDLIRHFGSTCTHAERVSSVLKYKTRFYPLTLLQTICSSDFFFNIVNIPKKERTLFLVFGALATLNHPKVCDSGEKITFEQQLLPFRGMLQLCKGSVKNKINK